MRSTTWMGFFVSVGVVTLIEWFSVMRGVYRAVLISPSEITLSIPEREEPECGLDCS